MYGSGLEWANRWRVFVAGRSLVRFPSAAGSRREQNRAQESFKKGERRRRVEEMPTNASFVTRHGDLQPELRRVKGGAVLDGMEACKCSE